MGDARRDASHEPVSNEHRVERALRQGHVVERQAEPADLSGIALRARWCYGARAMNRPIVVIPLTVAVSLLVMLGQTAVKHAINEIPAAAAGWAALSTLLRNRWFHLGVIVGAAGTFTWMYVLARAEFSYALPLLTVCGIVVAMLSAKVLLHESFGPARIAGTVLIAVGALLVARS